MNHLIGKFAGVVFLSGFFMRTLAAQTTLNDEARRLASEYRDSQYLRCDDSFYDPIMYILSGNMVIDQYKIADDSINVQSSILSDVDSLNGIEWEGIAIIYGYRYTRKYLHTGWGDWRDESHSDRSADLARVKIEIRKKKGKWLIGGAILNSGETFKAVLPEGTGLYDELKEKVQAQQMQRRIKFTCAQIPADSSM